MGNNKTIDGVPRELLERIAQWGSVSWPDKNELRALLAAPVVEPQACATVLMKIAADLANRKPLSQLYRICETQGRISSESLHEHLDKAGDLLAGVALDIRHALAKTQHQGEPSHWADAEGNTITAALKAHNLAMGGAPASASSHYTTALYCRPSAQPAPVPVASDEPQSRDYPHGESFYRNKDAD